MVTAGRSCPLRYIPSTLRPHKWPKEDKRSPPKLLLRQVNGGGREGGFVSNPCTEISVSPARPPPAPRILSVRGGASFTAPALAGRDARQGRPCPAPEPPSRHPCPKPARRASVSQTKHSGNRPGRPRPACRRRDLPSKCWEAPSLPAPLPLWRGSALQASLGPRRDPSASVLSQEGKKSLLEDFASPRQLSDCFPQVRGKRTAGSNYHLKATGLLETTFVFCSFCQRLEISFRLQMSEMRFYFLRQRERGRDTGRRRSRHHTESLRWDSIQHLQGLQDQALGCRRRQTAAPPRLLQYPPF
ncbi:unnamed protein product [Nyctereutes procyonoides]|uniref:(raccoon dog) hypothetical protein n=1 Tax=Nyctereutes procyonoides TaxID=34880 RepID=A0A811Z8V3_NYCPR|nr:unnamed protein product [Nyctereutes procyonoides]